MEKRIVLIGAGSSSFGPTTLMDLNLSSVLSGSTVVLHDINGEKLEMVYQTQFRRVNYGFIELGKNNNTC